MTHYVKTAAGISRGTIQWRNIAQDIEFVLDHDSNGNSTRTGNIGGVKVAERVQ